MSGKRVLALVLLGGVMLIDGYDLNAMALAVPWLAPELGLERRWATGSGASR